MNNKLYVGNLPYSINEDTLKDIFAEYGTVQSVKIIKDFNTGRSKGFGFVEMHSNEEAESVVGAINGKEVEGRELKVSKAKPPANKRNNRGGHGGFNKRN